MQGHGADVRTTTAVLAVAGYVLLAFLTMLVIVVVVFTQDDPAPTPIEERVPAEERDRAPGENNADTQP